MATARFEPWGTKGYPEGDGFCTIARTVVFPCKLLYEFLVFVELLEVVTRHSIGAMVLCAVDVMLIAENAVEREQCQRCSSSRGEAIVHTIC